MRLRRKPWARPELDACPFVIDRPQALRGRWAEVFVQRAPIHLELGCGKGAFIAEQALRNPQVNHLAVDIKSEVLALAKRNAERLFSQAGRRVDNLLLASYDIERIGDMLAARDSISRIYIHFCNPWPKNRDFKHRLTHPRQLEKYRAFLVPGGELYFKTDDDMLFAATLESLGQCGFAVVECLEDLPASHEAAAVMTEHERMFRQMGRAIKYIVARAPKELP